MGNVASTTTSFIDVRHLVKRYDDKLVLDDFDLTIDRGETCVIMGRSGSGKSTFTRLLIGLERPDSGEIWVAGEDTLRLSERDRDRVRRKFSMVFQQYALLDSMSVFDNVAFPLREELHVPEPEVRERVMRVLGELDVADASKKLPGELSGGMAKRVAIARAVVTEPEIVVYDEPTTGLDPVNARVADGLIDRMRDRYGVTSLVITHDMATAYGVADRVVLLAHGKAVAQGPPDELFRSHGAEIEPFALSSGVDPARLAPRIPRRPLGEPARWNGTPPPVTARSRLRAWLKH